MNQERLVGLGLLLILIVLASALRLHDLEGKTLWIDEANSVVIAQGKPGEILDRLALDSSPPLYYFTLRKWIHLFGDSEAAIRSLSAVGGVVLVAALYLIGWSLFSLEVGIVAGLLLTFSPVHVFYSQQARMYTWLTALAMISGYCLWRAATEDRRRFVVGYTATTLAALYLHNLAFYLLPGHILILAWQRAIVRNRLMWAAVGAVILIGYSPWLPTFLAQLGNETHYAWFDASWEKMGLFGALRYTALSFAPTLPELPFQFATPAVSNGAAAAAVLLLALASLTWLFRAPPGRRPSGPAFGWLIATVFSPLFFCLVASFLVRPNYVPGRSDQIVLPGFLLLVALGLMVLRPRAVRYLTLSGLLASACLGLNHYYGNESQRSERELAARISELARPGDAVICTSLSRAPLEYYLARGGGTPVTLFSYPRDTARHLGNQDDASLLASPDALEVEVDSVWAEVQRHFRESGQTRGQAFVLVVLNEVNRVFHEDLRSGSRSPVIELARQLGVFRCSGSGDPLGMDLVNCDLTAGEVLTWAPALEDDEAEAAEPTPEP